jgi:prevent-host-death family protein
MSFMKSASITQAKNNFSALIARVRAGQSVLITDRNRPVARIEPVRGGDETDDQRLARLERAGVIARGRGTLPKSFFQRPLPRSKAGSSALDALLEERSEGR